MYSVSLSILGQFELSDSSFRFKVKAERRDHYIIQFNPLCIFQAASGKLG